VEAIMPTAGSFSAELAAQIHHVASSCINSYSMPSKAADDRWTVEQLIERTACYNPPTALEQWIEKLPNDE
jgi:hypothetical protein